MGAHQRASIFFALLYGIGKRAYDFERDLEPRIQISDPIESKWPKRDTTNFVRYVSVDIKNVSYSHLRNCQVKSVRFTNADGENDEITNRIFRQDTERTLDNPDDCARSFDLRGYGDKVRIDIAALNESPPNKENVFMMYVNKNTPNSIPQKFFPHTLTIQVSAENLLIPECKTFKLWVDPQGRLKLEKRYDGPSPG